MTTAPIVQNIGFFCTVVNAGWAASMPRQKKKAPPQGRGEVGISTEDSEHDVGRAVDQDRREAHRDQCHLNVKHQRLPPKVTTDSAAVIHRSDDQGERPENRYDPTAVFWSSTTVKPVAPDVALLGTAHVRGLDVLEACGWLCPMTRDGIEDEETWLRRYVVRLRTILRFAVDARVQTELRGFMPKQRIGLNS